MYEHDKESIRVSDHADQTDDQRPDRLHDGPPQAFEYSLEYSPGSSESGAATQEQDTGPRHLQQENRIATLDKHYHMLHLEIMRRVESILSELALHAPILLSLPESSGFGNPLLKSRQLDTVLGQARIGSSSISDGLRTIALAIQSLELLTGQHAAANRNP